MHILIVDDQDTIIRIIKNLLNDLGYTKVTTAFNGDKACEILRKETIDLIISDWNMPNMSGFDLLKHVRADPKLANTPFIMVTAEAEKENIVAAIQADVDQYIVKPFKQSDLENKINLALKKRGKQ